MKLLVALAAIALPAGMALACSCPLDTQFYWDESTNVALVRINTTSVTARSHGGKPCERGNIDCRRMQLATFSVVETFKGSMSSRRRLVSGYGGGDCGIPLVSGAYYVVFLDDDRDEIGFCNSAGPYPNHNAHRHPYPLQMEEFVQSLRRAAKDPNAKVGKRPRPMTYDVLGQRRNW